MATPRKKPAAKNTAAKKVSTVRDEELSPLDIHAIQLNELYKSFRRAGFPVDICLTLITDPGAYPDWFHRVPDLEILDEEEEGD
jgi:hypothetical protein